jgi:hypothetical protein
VHKDGWLGISGQLQLFDGTAEAHVGQIEAEDLIRLVKTFTRRRLAFVEIVGHPNEL